ncbi:MAG: hypothetical protein QG583_258 [Patescibacteria group bacterium]|nr:hypothetical protein [Patescibacteria group bacterium]MDQ5962413.1 hypothetical protein [Patescibacteria group bacterium]
MIVINKSDGVVEKKINIDDGKTTLRHGFQRFLNIKKITQPIVSVVHLKNSTILSIDNNQNSFLVKLKYVEGCLVSKCDLDPEVFYFELSKIHTCWHNRLGEDFLENLDWNYFSKKYWIYINENEPDHPSIGFFKKYEEYIKLHFKPAICHNDIHFGNLIKMDGSGYCLLDLDEISISDFRNDIGVSCANIFFDKYKTPTELIDFLKKSLSSYLLTSNILIVDVQICLIYGLRKLYNAEFFYKLTDKTSTSLQDILDQQEIYLSAIQEIEKRLLK